MKSQYLLLTYSILLFTILNMFGCAPAAVYQGQSPVPPYFTPSSGGIIVSQQNLGLWVNGLGKSVATPDVVILSMGVVSQQKTVTQAMKEAIDAMNNVMQVLKNNGIPDKDIQTKQFNIQQVTRWDDKQSTSIVIGYKVSNYVTAKIRDTGKAGPVIDSAAVAGGDMIRVNGISFTVDDPTPFLKTARDKAIQTAMDKAKQMAQVSGIKLGKILYANEGTVYTPPVREAYMKISAVDSMPAAPTPISLGELEFQVTVEMVYEIN